MKIGFVGKEALLGIAGAVWCIAGFNIVRLGPGDAVGRHQHVGDMEVYHILKGQCRYDDNGTEVMLHAGDTAVCPDGEWHAVYNDGPDDMEMVCLILFK